MHGGMVSWYQDMEMPMSADNANPGHGGGPPPHEFNIRIDRDHFKVA